MVEVGEAADWGAAKGEESLVRERGVGGLAGAKGVEGLAGTKAVGVQVVVKGVVGWGAA